MRYIIILLFFFSRGRVTHTLRVFIWRPGRRTAPVMIPNAFRFLIEVLFYLVRRWGRLRFSYSFTARPVFVSTCFIVRNEIDFNDKQSVLMKTWVCSSLLYRGPELPIATTKNSQLHENSWKRQRLRIINMSNLVLHHRLIELFIQGHRQPWERLILTIWLHQRLPRTLVYRCKMFVN